MGFAFLLDQLLAEKKVQKTASQPVSEIELVQDASMYKVNDHSNTVESISTTENTSSNPVDLETGYFRLSFRELLAIRDIVPVAISYATIKCVRYSLLFWLPYYLNAELGYSTDIAGFASIAFDVGGIAGGLLIGRAADVLAQQRRILSSVVCLIFTGICLSCFSAVASINTLAALLAMGMVGYFIAGADSLVGGSVPSDLADRSQIPDSGLVVLSGRRGSVIALVLV